MRPRKANGPGSWKMDRKYKVIAVDFDETIGFGTWPTCIRGRQNKVLMKWLKKRRDMGDKIILWTCREDFGGKRFNDWMYKEEAVKFCRDRGLVFDHVNENDGETPEERSQYSRKVNADVYIDDKAIPFNMGGWFSGLKWRLFLKLVERKLDQV